MFADLEEKEKNDLFIHSLIIESMDPMGHWWWEWRSSISSRSGLINGEVCQRLISFKGNHWQRVKTPSNCFSLRFANFFSLSLHHRPVDWISWTIERVSPFALSLSISVPHQSTRNVWKLTGAIGFASLDAPWSNQQDNFNGFDPQMPNPLTKSRRNYRESVTGDGAFSAFDDCCCSFVSTSDQTLFSFGRDISIHPSILPSRDWTMKIMQQRKDIDHSSLSWQMILFSNINSNSSSSHCLSSQRDLIFIRSIVEERIGTLFSWRERETFPHWFFRCSTRTVDCCVHL